MATLGRGTPRRAGGWATALQSVGEVRTCSIHSSGAVSLSAKKREGEPLFSSCGAERLSATPEGTLTRSWLGIAALPLKPPPLPPVVVLASFSGREWSVSVSSVTEPAPGGHAVTDNRGGCQVDHEHGAASAMANIEAAPEHQGGHAQPGTACENATTWPNVLWLLSSSRTRCCKVLTPNVPRTTTGAPYCCTGRKVLQRLGADAILWGNRLEMFNCLYQCRRSLSDGWHYEDWKYAQAPHGPTMTCTAKQAPGDRSTRHTPKSASAFH